MGGRTRKLRNQARRTGGTPPAKAVTAVKTEMKPKKFKEKTKKTSKWGL